MRGTRVRRLRAQFTEQNGRAPKKAEWAGNLRSYVFRPSEWRALKRAWKERKR